MDQKKILLVEDEVLTRELYEEVLEEEGFAVSTAADGEEGLQKAMEGGFSLIILDIMLPKMDGLELLKALKASPPAKENGKILILSNLENDSITKAGIESGASDYLVKSNINPGQLVEKVKKLLEN
jgi:DNA-binding response OmpR family regulator